MCASFRHYAFDFHVCRNQPNYWAAYTHAKNGDHVNLEKEVRSFPNPVAVLNSVYGGNPTTMLHTAVYNGHVECVRCLLKLKAAPNVHNSYGKTAIEEGRFQGLVEIMKLLDAWGNAPAKVAVATPMSVPPPPTPVSPHAPTQPPVRAP